MIPSPISHRLNNRLRTAGRWLKVAVVLLLGGFSALSAQAATALADTPLFATTNVPGNLVLALSVEFPTAVTAADRNAFTSTNLYLGYFDSNKCYKYTVNDSFNTPPGYFFPTGATTGTSYTCSGAWSGNFLNWATMQAIDPFRWALTGGYRVPNADLPAMTILEKAVAPSNQGSTSNNFPNKSITSNISNFTPFSSGSLYMHVSRCGTKMVFTQNSSSSVGGEPCPASTAWDGSASNTSTVYSLQVRVSVCLPSMLESNCVAYGSNYKPEGLIQKYAQKIRYSAFGYLLDPGPTGGSELRDGGVLRARMKFVGPTQPVPGSTAITNAVGAVTGQVTSAEWDATTGIFIGNPDAADATASSETGSVIVNSGVINYLNQFGRTSQSYKYYDPVSELYYAATRYLRGLSNVSAYSDLTSYNGASGSTLANRTQMKDGFPVITNWVDPILYSCQKNFVLGIGDTNTNQDKDVPGNTTYRTNEPTMPPEVAADTIDAVAATNKVGVIEGIGTTIGNTNNYNASTNSAYIAGLAYLFNTTDIRPDLSGTQTISTFWLDVLEGYDSTVPGSGYKAGPTGRNQFYLAAKYGGFTVPSSYSYATNTTALNSSLWATTGDTIPIPSPSGPRPDNYFVANQADKMINGLNAAFQKIAATVAAFTTSFSTAIPQVATAGNASFSTQYDPATWTGEVTASELTFSSNGLPTVVVPAKWTFSSVLATQLATVGSVKGWDTNRRVVTYNGSTGVAFRASGSSALASADLTALDTSYVTGNDSANYLNYLRGDQSNEAGVSGGTQAYRARTKLIGDVVGSKATVVGTPSFPYADSTNPGYSAFKTQWTTTTPRRTVVYVGANDGMMHAINGALVTSASGTLEVDANAGKEMFAYVPRALFQGPNGTPNTDGLASLGNPSFTHHYFVNATPMVFDLDLSRTAGIASGTAPSWASVLIGGLGKGGKSYYALNVTDPVSMAGNEAAAASKVMWEFSNSTSGVSGSLGYTYGEPIVVKTKQYGWTVIFTSGYNNSDGKGYIFFVNPATGALLQKISTNVGSLTGDAGLAHANAFVVDSTDGTADAIYAGDLLGNLWRFDVTAATGAYPSPTLMATLTDASSAHNPQPVTSQPSIEVHPSTKKRFVMVGTGRLLDDTDIASTQGQTFYVIADGTNASFNTNGSPLSFPYTRSTLANNTNALTGVTFVPSTQAGWFEDLGTDPTTGIAWRVTSDSTTLAGSVAFSATLPNGQACNPSGSSRVYARDYATAVTTVKAIDNTGVLNLALYVPLSGTVTDLHYFSVGGQAVLVAGTDTGTVSKIEIAPLGNLKLRRLNWRELQLTD